MKTIDTTYQNIMFIFSLLQHYPVKKRAHVQTMNAISAKLSGAIENPKIREEELGIKNEYLVLAVDDAGEPILDEDGKQKEGYDRTKEVEMFDRVYGIKVSVELNTHEITMAELALDNALKANLIKGPMNAKLFAAWEELLK